MYDPASAYRTSQVTTASPASQVVLLYQGAIRFGHQHIAALTTGNLEEAHRASLRCQEIVGALQAALDRSAGPIAENLDGLYAFVLSRLVDGNIAKRPRPTEEALEVLHGLLEAWQRIASGTPRLDAAAPTAGGVYRPAPFAGIAPSGAR
jgi:flagellar protein FliS